MNTIMIALTGEIPGLVGTGFTKHATAGLGIPWIMVSINLTII